MLYKLLTTAKAHAQNGAGAVSVSWKLKGQRVMQRQVRNWVIGAAALAASALSAGAAQAVTYTVVQGSNVFNARPITGPQGLVTMYNYSAGSAHSSIGIENSNANTATLFLFQSTTNGQLGLFGMFGGQPGGNAGSISGSLSGLPGSSFIAVKDDPSLLHDVLQLSGSTANFSFHWAKNKNDGFGIGGLANQLWTITFTLGSPTLNVANYRIAYQSGGTIQYSALSPLTNGSTFQFVAALVPEPATWAMMIAAFGLLGAAAKRRKALVAAA